MNNPRVAWLLTSAFYYWQPLMKSFTEIFPQTTVFTSRWHGFAPGFEDSFNLEIVGNRKVFVLKQPSADYGSSFTYLPLSIISRLLRYKPQMVFSNSFGIWTILALLFKSLGGWRVVIAYEGSSPSIDYRHSMLRLSIRRAMARMADAFITNSQAGKTYLVEVLKAKASHVFQHPYEVPVAKALLINHLEGGLSPLRLKRPVFLFVGSLTPRKGLHLLLQACALLRKEGYHNYTLLVVGDGQQRQELEEFSKNHKLEDCLHWTGRVDYGSLGAYFGSADVFVLPTLEDTWGMVVLEAMVLGKPVLCSNRAGAAEMVLEGENGYCFNPDNVTELAQLMRRFIANPDLSISLGYKAQQHMAQYTPEAAAKFLAKVTAIVT